MGHEQPATPLKTDNSTALSFVKNNITQKRSKSWDMSYYWLCDKQNQKDFDIFWDKSENNMADYHTKHHSVQHHLMVRHKYVQDKQSATVIKDNACSARVCWNWDTCPSHPEQPDVMRCQRCQLTWLSREIKESQRGAC